VLYLIYAQSRADKGIGYLLSEIESFAREFFDNASKKRTKAALRKLMEMGFVARINKECFFTDDKAIFQALALRRQK
jgi:hypothetical protein